MLAVHGVCPVIVKAFVWRRTPVTAGKVERWCLWTSHLVYRFGGMKGKGAGRIHPWNRIIIIVSLFLEEPVGSFLLVLPFHQRQPVLWHSCVLTRPPVGPSRGVHDVTF